MRTVNLAEEPLDLAAVLHLAGQEPVLLLTPDGKEFVLTEADDFEREVESLRRSSTFQQFLEERSKDRRRIPLEEVEREIEQDLPKGESA
jgi:PHD/YefM family antitoxin component YafN of YafNO toxin-antitoxin module